MKVKKKRTGPGEVLMWFGVALIIVGIVLGIGYYIGDFSIITLSAVFVVVGIGVAILAKTITR